MKRMEKGDYIELKTGSVAKVLEITKNKLRLRVLTNKGYTYQYEKPKSHIAIMRTFSTEWILRRIAGEE